MIYDPDSQRALAEQTVAGIYDAATRINPEVIQDAQRTSDLIDAAAHELSLLTYWLKNPAFSAEQEWRLVLEAGTIQSLGTRPLFRSSSFGVTPYFVWKPSDPAMRLPITSAMVGPSPWPEAAMFALDTLLVERGYSGVPIDASTIPIR